MTLQQLTRTGTVEGGVEVDIINIENSVSNRLFVEFDVFNVIGLDSIDGSISVTTGGGFTVGFTSWSQSVSGDPTRVGVAMDFNQSTNTDVEVTVTANGPYSSGTDQQSTTILVEPNLSLTGCEMVTPSNGATIQEDERVEVGATVSNGGAATGSMTLAFEANGVQFDSATVEVDPDSNKTVFRSFTPQSYGLTGDVDITVTEA